MIIYFLLLVIFLSGIISFILNRKHLLLILLSLEFIVIALYIQFFFYLRNINYEYFFSIIFLTIRVCEGSLGLAILIIIVRVYGNDYILTFSSLW